MNRYLISYYEGKGGETQKTQVRGYDEDHALERFFDSMEEEGGTQGVNVLSIHKVQLVNGFLVHD